MCRIGFKSGMLVFLSLLFIGFNSPVVADDKSETEPVFVDLDGDGFNDKTTDFENKRFLDDKNESGVKSGGMISFDNFFSSEEASSNQEVFKTKKFAVISLSSNRSEADASFGTSQESAGGSSQSSGCVGGVCTR